MKGKPDISIILPCYNPPLNWEKIVVESFNTLSSAFFDKSLELIIVDDGTDKVRIKEGISFLKNQIDTFSFAEHTENKGKGSAIRTGVNLANGNFIIYTDIDFPYTVKSIQDLYSTSLSNCDVVLGHRDTSYYSHTPWARKVISKSLRFSLKTLLRLPTDDSQCGLKGFNHKGKEIFLQTKIDRFLFDLEFIKLVSKKGLNIQNCEVQLKEGVVFSKVKFKILIREGLNFLKILFR